MLKAACEDFVRYVLPALRGALVTYMYVEKKMKQLDIAKLMGISQSAVSRYINMERGLYRRMVEQMPGMKDLLERVVFSLEQGEKLSACELCRAMKEKGLLEEAIKVVESSKFSLRSPSSG
ncbi:MAG: helix-turn-helix domain-containing protein [Thermofilaceae archaeon]|nr:helix-turn-helix domain-containing protein [Thermofilaceae archaeon]MCX8181365.1 helix-turn-helix domain-containing protein [Thermofilaceae archaeon]MDW8004675.1 helix-turn-helix domain-containing protein [Thermofilaceae archaeon]